MVLRNTLESGVFQVSMDTRWSQTTRVCVDYSHTACGVLWLVRVWTSEVV